jgi:serine/threonine-protein kinase
VIFWSSRGNGEAGIFSQAPDGAGQAERLTTSSATQVALWSIYGTQLVLSDPYTPSGDIHLLSLEGEPATRRLIPPTASPTWEGNAAVSPNGRWIAYDSDETGESQIYVQSFPNVDEGRVTISIDGGNEPVWSRDGTELFFRNGDAVMAVGVEDDEAFSPGAPEVLFTGSYWSAGDSTPNYDVAADGRFLMMRSAGASGQGAAQALEQTLLVTVENWFEELRRLAPPSR